MDSAFLSRYRHRFSLHGTNTLGGENQTLDLAPAAIPEFTRHNHFRFGFNGGAFNCKRSYSAQYVTSYGSPQRASGDLKTELFSHLEQVSSSGKPLFLQFSASPQSRALVAAARELSLDFQQIVVHIEDQKIPFDDSIPTREFVFSLQEIAAVLGKLQEKILSACPAAALHALILERVDGEIILDQPANRVINVNFDALDDSLVGIPYLALVDSQRFTDIHRWCVEKQKACIPNFFKISPEIMAAQFSHPAQQAWIYSVQAGRNNFQVEAEVFTSLFPNSDIPVDKNYFDPFAKHIDWKRNLLKQYPAAALDGPHTAWYSPLHRIFSRFGLEYPAKQNLEKIYGRVEAL